MKTLSLSFFLICFISCKTTKVYNDIQFKKINKTILLNPENFLRKDLSTLLNEMKEVDYEIEYHTVRHFIISSISFNFENNISVQVFFNKNTDYNFGGGLFNKGTWDMEELKELKLSAIKIYQNEKLISHHCIWKYCKI